MFIFLSTKLYLTLIAHCLPHLMAQHISRSTCSSSLSGPLWYPYKQQLTLHVGLAHIPSSTYPDRNCLLSDRCCLTLFKETKQQRKPANYVSKSVKWECSPPT